MKKKIMNSVLLLLLGVTFFVFAVGSGSTTSTGGNGEKLELVDSKGYDDGYSSYYVEGTIKNNSSEKYSYAQVTFTLYDESGAQIGTAMDNINDLEPGGTWKFKAICLAPSGNVASYKLSEITGW